MTPLGVVLVWGVVALLAAPPVGRLLATRRRATSQVARHPRSGAPER